MLWDAVGYSEMLWDAVGCHGMLWDAVGYCGMLRDAMGFPKSKGRCEPRALRCAHSRWSQQTCAIIPRFLCHRFAGALIMPGVHGTLPTAPAVG